MARPRGGLLGAGVHFKPGSPRDRRRAAARARSLQRRSEALYGPVSVRKAAPDELPQAAPKEGWSARQRRLRAEYLAREARRDAG